MPDMSMNVFTNTVLRAQTNLLTLISNALAAIEESYREQIKHEIQNYFDKMLLERVPWNEQLIKLQQKIATDDRLTPEVKTKIDEIIVKEFEKTNLAKTKTQEGLDELRRTFKKSRLPKEDKQILEKILNQAQYEQHDPMHVTVDRACYRALIKELKSKHMINQISAIQTVSGDYLVLYSAAMDNEMQGIMQNIGLKQGRLPRPTVEDILQYASITTDEKIHGSYLRFEGLSEELAEKAIMESTKSRDFSFAKALDPDTETYTLYCYSGRTPEEKQKYYQEAVQTIALAAFSLTGPTGEIEKKRALHSSKENEKIEMVLNAISNDRVDEEDSGYIYSIHSITDQNNNRYILTDDYIQFNP